jgi:hypothetical protein
VIIDHIVEIFFNKFFFFFADLTECGYHLNGRKGNLEQLLQVQFHYPTCIILINLSVNSIVEEQLEIITWGGSKDTLQSLIAEVVDFRFQRHKTHTRVYTVNENNKWNLAAVKVKHQETNDVK